MAARFIPLTANKAVPVIVVQRPVLLIGRHVECDARIDLPEVSRRHCCVAQADDRLLIRDLGSRNGVCVNGRRVEEAQLVAGDEIAIAKAIYRLEFDPEPEPAPAPAAPPGKAASVPSDPSPLPLLSDDDDLLIPLD